MNFKIYHAHQFRIVAFSLAAAAVVASVSCARQPAAPQSVRLGINVEAARTFAAQECKGCGGFVVANAILNVATALATTTACRGIEVMRYGGVNDEIARNLRFDWVVNLELTSDDDRHVGWTLQSWEHGDIIYQGQGEPLQIAREVCAILLRKGAIEEPSASARFGSAGGGRAKSP